MTNDDTRHSVGILSPGEMGAAVGDRLVELGIDVVTTCDGRGAATHERCKQAGFTVVPSLEEVVAASDLLVSLVPPAAAVALANDVVAALADDRPLLYVDANSISPDTARTIEGVMNAHGVGFVDAAIHGQARRMRESGTLYLSGARAAEVAKRFDGVMSTVVVSSAVGSASMMKMVMGGMSKGLVALFLEMASVARAAGLKDEFLVACQQYYPGIMTALSRMLPTVPHHAERRGQEMAELEDAIRTLDLRPGFATEARRLYTTLGDSGLPRNAGSEDLSELIELVARENPFAPDDPKEN